MAARMTKHNIPISKYIELLDNLRVFCATFKKGLATFSMS